MPWQPLTDKPAPPTRLPNDRVGTLGRRIALRTNYFCVEMQNPNKTLIHYHVEFKEYVNKICVEASGMPKKKKQSVFEEMKRQYPKVFCKGVLGFDCEKSAYSVESVSKELEQKEGTNFEVKYDDEGKKKTYYVNIRVVNRQCLSTLVSALRVQQGQKRELPTLILQMLEILLNHPASIRYEKVGRNNFFSLGGEFGRSMDIGGGKEAIVGFFESLRPIGWKKDTLLLNVDVANSAFYKEQSVLDLMINDLGFRDVDLHGPLNESKRIRLKKELKNMKIKVTHTFVQRTYKVTDIGILGADRQDFMLDGEGGRKRKITVQKYFDEQYKKKLDFPRLNCLKVGPVNRDIFIPIEVCKVAKGQRVNKKLNDREVAQFIRGTAKMPYERMNSICNAVKKLNFNNDPVFRALQFSISDQPMNLDGRVLPAPQLKMNDEFMPDKGVWDSRSRTFFSSATLEHWVVANYDSSYIPGDVLNKFLFTMNKMGKERGMSISKPELVRSFQRPNPEVDFLEIKKRFPNTQLILVVLPKFGDLYPRVKKIGDRVVQIVTQCVQGGNVMKCSPPTVGNLLLKVNAKLGGTNNILGEKSQPIVFSQPVMIMGADVNHPPAHDKNTPSLAAVVASLDRFACKYASEVRHQKHRTEMIQDLKDMTKNLLMSFYTATKRKPTRIVMYRDGVSESQFLEVLSFELKAMRQACTELGADYKPGMTFILVQKRHHTRLFCSDRDAVGRSKNIPPGTTVDSMITHPAERDFYLCSHQGIQGTSRPTHYHVLWDDNDLTMDQLQSMTYAMCHLYSRCTRSVSIPTPAYYAHLVAFRAKVHIRDICQSETSSLSSGESEGILVSDATMTQAAKIDRQNSISSKLYYV